MGAWFRLQSIALAAVALTGTARAQGSAPPGVDLSKWKGQVVLVDFWASWCAPCRESFPWMARMAGTYGPRGLVVVAVNLDEDPDAARQFLAGVQGDFVHVQDPEGRIAEAYGLSVMPSSVLFDREGRPIYRHQGFHPDQAAEYEQHIVELLDNRGPATALAIEAAKPVAVGVHPWERSVLADPIMQLVRDPLEIEFDDHIYFSKEASSGGRGFGGGGCGCN